MSMLNTRGRQLEDLFFAKQDALLIEKRRELEHMERTRKALAEVSGIQDSAVLDKLMELEITPDLLASLAVVPLLEVAWADGHVDDRERAAVLAGAAGSGFGALTVDYSLLEEWLRRRPPPKLLSAWMHYIRDLCGRLGDDERRRLKSEIMTRTRQVADAAGGFLGLTSRVSPSEQAMIEKLAGAFGAD